jgi:diaminopimelate decarboxylase
MKGAEGVGPDSLTRGTDGTLAVGGVPVPVLADRFGTPLYVVDIATLEARQAAWRAAVGAHGDLYYAAKAFWCRAMAEWVAAHNLGADVVSGGELYTALVAGMDPGRIIVHGNVKTAEEMSFALRSGVGHLVIDSLFEVPELAAHAKSLGQRPSVWIRVTPDVAAPTHAFIQTGHHASKFGLAIEDGSARAAVDAVLAEPGLRLTGYHMHIGSQITLVAPYEEALVRLMRWAREVYQGTGFWPPQVDAGGGLGVAYRPGDAEPTPTALVNRLVAVLAAETPAGLPVPRLALEPGRSLVAPAGITVYRVAGIKDTPGGHVFVMVDGGMGDNIRPALYQAEYTVWSVAAATGPMRRVTIAGRYCETGDLIAADVPLPPLNPGDLVVVLTTGAYNYSMSSNYNRVPRPAVVAVENGAATVWVERESWADLVRHDRPLSARDARRLGEAGE